MATDPNFIIQGLLQGTGFGRTVADNQQQQGQIQAQQTNNQLGQLRLAQEQQQQAQATQYADDVKGYFADPKPARLAMLVAKYPQQAEAFKASKAILDEPQRTSQLGQYTQMLNAAQNNRPDLLSKQIADIASAEKANGIQHDPEVEQIQTLLNSGDPVGVKAALAFSQMHLAALDPAVAKSLGIGEKSGQDKFSNTPQGDIYNRETGERFSYSGGGGPASTGAPSGPTVGGVPVTATTPFASVKQHIINHEAPDAVGGYNALAYNVPSGQNAAGLTPVNLTGMTIGQVLDYQKGPMRAATKGQRGSGDVGSTGVGAYQFESGTLAQNAAKALGPNWRDQPFSPENQDKIAETLWNDVRGDPTKLGNTWAAFKDQIAAPKPQNPSQLAHADPTKEFYAQKLAAGMDPVNLARLFPGKENAGTRAQIAARSAEIQQGQGLTAGASNLQTADVKSAATALTALQRTRNSLDPYLATFDGNVAQVRQLAPQGVGGSIPIFNRWIQAGRNGGKGDPALAKFNVAINAVANENAKIMSGATGGAVSSDSARHEAMSLINNAQTLPQLMGALDQMQTDTKIRLKGLDDRQEVLRGRISGRATATAGAAPAPAIAKLRANPQLAQYFDAKYGPGAAKRALGR